MPQTGDLSGKALLINEVLVDLNPENATDGQVLTYVAAEESWLAQSLPLTATADIVPGSSKITVFDDVMANEIQIDVSEANLTLNNIGGTLSVSKGGTGATTFSSGNFLQGNGTSAVTASKAVPTGDVVGTSDTQTLTNKTLTSPVLTTPQINDSALDHQYIFASANLAADRTVSLPLLTGNDTFVFEDHTQTLTNKTINTANNTLTIDAGDVSTGTLSVARGGTGSGSHNSGNVLVGAGTSAITSTKVAPTGDFVGTSDTQTLTNKTLTSPVLTTPQINDSALDHQYIFASANLAADRTVTLPLLTGNDTFVFEAHSQTLTNKTIDADNNTVSNLAHGAEVDNPSSGVHGVTGSVVGTTDTQTLTNKTLTSPTLTTPQINDSALDHQYIFSSADLAADRTVSLPLLTGNDTFVFEAHSQTLTNKTIDNTNNITVQDTNFTIQDSGDNTKQIQFNPSPLASGTTRIYSTPNGGGGLLVQGTQYVISGTSSPVFRDGALTSFGNAADITKLLQFDLSGLTSATTRTATWPDADLTVVGTDTTQTLTNKTLGTTNFITVADSRLTLVDNISGDQLTYQLSGLTANRIWTAPDASGTVVLNDNTQTLTNKTLTSPVLTTPQINDTSLDHQYIFSPSELIADRTVTLPLLTGNDTFVFEAHSQTLTNKTINSTTNTVTADNLHSATTTIDVVSATAPTTGQVLTATSSTAATWQNIAPAGTVVNYAGTTEPTGWLFCYGQAISRTTYSVLFAVISTTYGVGDGSTTFNLPDLRGRAIAGKDDMGGASANRLTGTSGGVDGDGLGNSGGAEQHTLTTAELASHSHTTPSRTAHDVTGSGTAGVGYAYNGANGGSFNVGNTTSAGSNNAHNNVQPTFILNMIIKT